MDYESVQRGLALTVGLIVVPAFLAAALSPRWSWLLWACGGGLLAVYSTVFFILGYQEGQRKKWNVTVNHNKSLIMPTIMADQADIADIRRQF